MKTSVKPKKKRGAVLLFVIISIVSISFVLINFIDKRRDQNAFYRAVRRNFPQIVGDGEKNIITNFPEIECQSQMNFVKYHLYRYFRCDHRDRYMWACYPSPDDQPQPDQGWIDNFRDDVRVQSKFPAFDIGRTFVLGKENSVFPCPDTNDPNDQWECEISFKMVDDKIPYIPKFNEELEIFFDEFFTHRGAPTLIEPATTALLQNFRKEVMAQDKGINHFLSKPWLGTEYFIHDSDTFTLELSRDIVRLSRVGLCTSDNGRSMLDDFISFPPPEGIDAVNFFALYKYMQAIVYASFWGELDENIQADKGVSWSGLTQFESAPYDLPKDLDFQNEKKSFLNEETRDLETSWSIFATAISPALEPYMSTVDEFLWPEDLGVLDEDDDVDMPSLEDTGDIIMGGEGDKKKTPRRASGTPEVGVKRYYYLSPRQRADNKLLDMLRRDVFQKKSGITKAETPVKKDIKKVVDPAGTPESLAFWSKYKSAPKFRNLGFQNEDEFNDMKFNWIPARIKAFITRDKDGKYFSYSGAVQIEVKVWRKNAPWVCASQREIFNLARYDDFDEPTIGFKY